MRESRLSSDAQTSFPVYLSHKEKAAGVTTADRKIQRLISNSSLKIKFQAELELARIKRRCRPTIEVAIARTLIEGPHVIDEGRR